MYIVYRGISLDEIMSVVIEINVNHYLYDPIGTCSIGSTHLPHPFLRHARTCTGVNVIALAMFMYVCM